MRTRWVEEHDPLLSFASLFEPVIIELEEIKSKGNPESFGNIVALALLSPANELVTAMLFSRNLHSHFPCSARKLIAQLQPFCANIIVR